MKVQIKNTSGQYLHDAVYLEEPDPIISLPEGLKYTLEIAGKKTDAVAESLTDGDYSYAINNLSLAPGTTATITYTGLANPVDIGRINVGTLESDDAYGDIALNPSKICGATYILWKSTAKETYSKINKTFTSSATSPVNTTDTDKLKEYTDELATATEPRRTVLIGLIRDLSSKIQGSMPSMFEDSDGNGIPDSQEMPDGDASILSEQGMTSLSNSVDDVVK